MRDAIAWLTLSNKKIRANREAEHAMRLARLRENDRAYAQWLAGNGGQSRHETVVDHGDTITRYRGNHGVMS